MYTGDLIQSFSLLYFLLFLRVSVSPWFSFLYQARNGFNDQAVLGFMDAALEAGQVVDEGPAEDVVDAYLNSDDLAGDEPEVLEDF